MYKVQMSNNFGVNGGCIAMSNSKFIAKKSVFQDNVAVEGGFLFVISKSNIDFEYV